MQTNKSLWPQYRWDWFGDNASGYNLYGKMDGGDIGLGNPLGANSKIYGSIDTNDFGFPGPKGAKLKYWGHLSNDFSYALDAIRRASRGIKHADRVYHLFDSNTNQQELDATARDSIFENEMVPVKTEKFFFGLHERFEFGFKKDPYVSSKWIEIYVKRKDSLNTKINNTAKMDSIRKFYKPKP